MMTRERFKDLMNRMQEHNELYEKLYELGLDAINCKYMETAGIFFDELMKSEFGEDGLDTITWWLYEDVDHCIYQAYTDKLVADLNNIDDLYDYLALGGLDGLDE